MTSIKIKKNYTAWYQGNLVSVLRIAFVATVNNLWQSEDKSGLLEYTCAQASFKEFGNKHPDAKNFILTSMSISIEDGTHETFQ
jgi:hypothetical protein